MTGGLCINPASIRNGRHNDASLFSPNIDGCTDYMSPTGHEQAGLGHSPAFSAFDTAYDMAAYQSGPSERPQANDPLNINEHPPLIDIMANWHESMHLPHRG